MVDGEGTIVPVPEHQIFVDKYENRLKEVFTPKEKTPCESRTNKGDSRFRNEDGTVDHDTFPGNKI